MSSIKVCLIITSLQSGGSERVMSELANNFSLREGVEVSLVLYGIDPSVFYTLSEKITIVTPNWQFNNKRRIWHSLRRMYFLRSTIQKINPSTILSFGEFWNSFVLLALLGLRFPVFVSDRCQPDKSLGRVHDLLRKLIYRTAAGVIAQTEKAKEIFDNQYLNKRIVVIGNPIHSVENYSIIKQENFVLSVGRLIASKNHDLLIDIFLKCSMPEWKLVIVGGDAIKQNVMARLVAKLAELKAGDRVCLAGNQSDVDKYYCQSSIFAFASSSEGFPNVVGEAMSAGLPVVAFDCVAGPADLIEDGENGFLVPLMNEEIFVSKLKFLMQNEIERKRMSQNAEKSVLKFSVDSIGDKYLNFILSHDSSAN